MDETSSTTTPVCYRHPDRATRLACSQCGRPICVDCSHDAAVGQRCPECAKPDGRHQVIHAGRQMRRGTSFETSPVTMSLIAINAAIFLVGIASPSLGDTILNNFAQINLAVDGGEWWRAITATFLHGTPMHILFNMYALYLLGGRMEPSVGSVPFAGIYLASALAGSAASYFLGPDITIINGTAFATSSVGASGAIFGLFGAWLVNAYRARHTPAGRAMLNQFGMLLLINLALPLFIRNIDWRAHLGGLAAGALIAWAWSRITEPGRPGMVQRTSVAVFVGLPVLIAIVVSGL
jgi:membrane associated rhomboid family serine protease